MEPRAVSDHSSSELETKGRKEIGVSPTSSSAREATADSSASPSALVGSTQKGNRKRKSRVTTSSPAPDQSPPLLDLDDNSEAAAETGTDSSSGYSSPLRKPMSLFVEKITSEGIVKYDVETNPEILSAYQRDSDNYQKKLARLQELPTLKQYKVPQNVTDWHDLTQKNAVLDAARSVLFLSSSDGTKEINRCSGIIIEWVETHKTGVIVTSSQIICTKVSWDDWEDNNVYATDAKVTAHLLDGSTCELDFLYCSKHYDLAFFKVMGVSGLQALSLSSKLEYGHEVCVLGRDKDLELVCSRERVLTLDPCDHQKNHYSFIGGQVSKCCIGGALIKFDREVVGMVLGALPNYAFVPSSLILNCLRLWKKFGEIARPHLGLKLTTVAFMDISHQDHLSRMFGINCGLIVAKVSAESLAEEKGVRIGDVILSCQGETLSTISQFEGILLGIFEKQYEKCKDLNCNVDVEVGVYNLRKKTRRSVVLSVQLSDCMEIVK